MKNILAKKYLQQYEMMIDWVNGDINSLSDEEFKMEVTPGKNHGVWIFGHLIVSDDDFSAFMGKGDVMFPDYQDLFGQGSKLQTVENYPKVEELREKWYQVCEKNKKIYSSLMDKEFDEQHAMVKDYEKDYFKTKERVVMAWQFHQVYHAGQLAILVSKAGKSKY